MNAAELIDLLRQCDPDRRVVIYGDEDGFDDIAGFKMLTILVNANQVPRPWRWPKTQTGEVMNLPSEFGAGAHAAVDSRMPDAVREKSLREETIYICRKK